MSWHASDSRPNRSDDILFLPASAKTVSQAEIDALEAKRIRRLRELGDWRPSRGWHIEPSLSPAAVPDDKRSRRAARTPRSSDLSDAVVVLRLSGARQSARQS